MTALAAAAQAASDSDSLGWPDALVVIAAIVASVLIVWLIVRD